MARQDVDFAVHGSRVRGWYWPGPAGRRAPAVLMAHGFSAVKEQGLAPFAEAFAAAGLAVLVIDFRCLGASEGEPRGLVDPQMQQDDLRAALGWLAARPDVDPARLGLWGTSYSGGHALFLGALDPRVKAVVAQVPAVSVGECFRRLIGDNAFDGFLHMLSEEHGARASGAAPRKFRSSIRTAGRRRSAPRMPSPGSSAAGPRRRPGGTRSRSPRSPAPSNTCPRPSSRASRPARSW